MPDIYITTIRRLYEIKKNVQDVKDSIGQLKSLMNYPRMKSYFIVVCEDLERKEKNELKKFLMDNNVINARIESWKEIFDKLGIGVN